MMRIRYGTYTVYDNIEMQIISYYGHGLSQDIDENHRIISYTKEYGQLEGFSFDEQSNKFIKDILINDLSNSFFVITKAKYKGEVFEVEPYYGDEVHLHLATKDLELGKRLNFHELHDGYGKLYYLGEISINEVEKLWEERTQSNYNLPMPERIELIKELEIPKNI